MYTKDSFEKSLSERVCLLLDYVLHCIQFRSQIIHRWAEMGRDTDIVNQTLAILHNSIPEFVKLPKIFLKI